MKSDFRRSAACPLRMKARSKGKVGALTIVREVSIRKGNRFRGLPARGRRSRRFHSMISRDQSSEAIALRRLVRKYTGFKPLYVERLEGGRYHVFRCLMVPGTSDILRRRL
jgi:hypothetical protein